MIERVPKACRMPYSLASSGILAAARARCIRLLKLQRFHGVPRWVRKTRSPGSLRDRIAMSNFTTSGCNGMMRGFGTRWVRLVLCFFRTMTALLQSTSSQRSWAASPGRAPVYRRNTRSRENVAQVRGYLGWDSSPRRPKAPCIRHPSVGVAVDRHGGLHCGRD